MTDETSTEGARREPGPGIPALVAAFAELRIANTRLLELLAGQLSIVPTDIRALVALTADGDVTPKRVAEQLELSTGAMTTLLDRLENAGYARRVSNPSDRRSLLVELTDEGRDALAICGAKYYDAFEVAVPEAERERLALSFTAVAEQLRRQADTLA